VIRLPLLFAATAELLHNYVAAQASFVRGCWPPYPPRYPSATWSTATVHARTPAGMSPWPTDADWQRTHRLSEATWKWLNVTQERWFQREQRAIADDRWASSDLKWREAPWTAGALDRDRLRRAEARARRAEANRSYPPVPARWFSDPKQSAASTWPPLTTAPCIFSPPWCSVMPDGSLGPEYGASTRDAWNRLWMDWRDSRAGGGLWDFEAEAETRAISESAVDHVSRDVPPPWRRLLEATRALWRWYLEKADEPAVASMRAKRGRRDRPVVRAVLSGLAHAGVPAAEVLKFIAEERIGPAPSLDSLRKQLQRLRAAPPRRLPLPGVAKMSSPPSAQGGKEIARRDHGGRDRRLLVVSPAREADHDDDVT